MVLSAWGKDVDEAKLRQLANCTPFGTDAFQLVEAARTPGFEAIGVNPLYISKTPLMLFLVVILYQGCAVVGEAKGQQQQGATEKQISGAQTATPSVLPDIEQSKAGEAGERADNKQQITITDTRSNALEWAAIVLNIFFWLLGIRPALTNSNWMSCEVM